MTQTLLEHPDRIARGDVVVSVRNLTKAYGDRTVLDGLSFDVHHQEIFGILGPNGTGKTTTVEIAQGLRRADHGELSVLGLDPDRDRHRLRRSVGSQLQSSALPERLRVGEALRLFARLAGDVVDWRQLSAEWELTKLEGSPFRALSGGEQQRLFLALALVNKPRLVFLDELTQGLDPGARRETWRLIERIRDEGTTVVLVSHYMDEVEQLCDRIGVLADGRMDVVGTPAELVAGHGERVHTRFSLAGPSLQLALAGLPGVAEVHVAGAAYDVVGGPETPVKVAAELDRRSHLPTDFTVQRPSLEDVFVAMTRGDR